MIRGCLSQVLIYKKSQLYFRAKPNIPTYFVLKGFYCISKNKVDKEICARTVYCSCAYFFIYLVFGNTVAETSKIKSKSISWRAKPYTYQWSEGICHNIEELLIFEEFEPAVTWCKEIESPCDSMSPLNTHW